MTAVNDAVVRILDKIDEEGQLLSRSEWIELLELVGTECEMRIDAARDDERDALDNDYDEADED